MKAVGILVLALLTAACTPSPRSRTTPTQPVPEPGLADDQPPEPQRAPTIEIATLHDKASLRALPPLELGQFRVHLIDVGTGLAILVQGADFNFLYDGGSGDDYRGGKNSRLVAYLAAVLGPSGGAKCKPNGDEWPEWDVAANVRLDHVMQSHPHLDHGSMLDDVFACFEVATFWDSGVINQAAFIEDLWRAVAAGMG
jgi:beta-lactamase superfamily II metal-dependent hydrolase